MKSPRHDPSRSVAPLTRLQEQFHNLTLVHLPTHASWLKQIEIYFSILQRKALSPAHFTSPDDVARRILRLSGPLPADRIPLRMDLHAPRPAPPHASLDPLQARCASPPTPHDNT